MKKIFFLSLLSIVLVCGSATAQFKFGVKGGLNFTNFNSAKDFDNSTGWHLGLVSQVSIPVVGLGLQPELLYTVAKSGEGSINYIQIPINIRYQLIPGPIRPIILAGPYFSYASNFSGVFNGNTQRLDWGLGLGAGVEIWKIQFAGRYSWGLQNISKADDVNIKNNAFTLSLAYFF